MKTNLLLTCSLLVLAGCGMSNHPLASVADKVPVSFECPPSDVERAAQLVESFARDPERVVASLKKRVTRSPGDAATVACELRDVKFYLESTGQQATDAYKQTVKALEALKKLAPGV